MDLLERDADLEELESAMVDARTGRGSLALVSGEAGIGKTQLVHEFTDRQAADKTRVLWGGCDDLSTPRTLGPFRDIARQVGGELEVLINSGAARTEVFDAALVAISDAAVTVVVLEDVHWADGATLDVLKFLGRRIDRIPALLVATFREEDVPALHPLRRAVGDVPSGALHRLSLAPLSRNAVATLAVDYEGSVDELYAATRGNPFFVSEAIRNPGSDVSESVRDAVAARAARLSEAARGLVEFVSVVPGSAERWLFEPNDGLADAVDESQERGFLVSDDQSVWFRHELVRRAVEESLSTQLRRELNQRVLERLQEAGAEIERIVHHANEAGANDVVVRTAPEAAVRASAAASHREALSHYRLAVQHLDLLAPAEQAGLLSEYGVECYMANSAAEGLQAVEQALRQWRSLGEDRREGDMLRWQSRLHWWLGHGKEAEQAGVEAVAVLEQLPPTRELAMAYSNLGQINMLAQRFEPAEQWATKAIELARRLDDQSTLAHALNNLGSARLRIGDKAAYALLEESLAISLREGLDDDAGRAYANLIWTALDYRDYAVAERYLDDGLAFAIRREVGGGRYYMMAERARFRFEQGDWQGAGDDVEWVLRQPEEPGITQMPARAVLARLQVRTGHPDADASVEAAWRLAEPTGELQRMAPVSAARAERAWLRGDKAATAGAVSVVYASARVAQQPWITDELAFWVWRAGALDEPPESSTPFALQIAGDAAGAAEAWGRLGCPYERALALADTEEPDRLLEALHILDELGAVPAAGLVRSTLRKLGVQGVPRGPRRRTRANPAGLTPRQVDVLGLLVEDLTNAEIAERLFVSPKTVDHHVSAILTKLEAANRQEAAALARTMGLIPT